MAEVQKDHIGSTEDTLRFLDMIGLFSSQAMIGLGKVVNPSTKKAEKNLPLARLFIDTLEMIDRKTRGNLTSDESKALRATLTDLRLMYVEESQPSASRPEEKEKAPGPESEEKPAIETPPVEASATDETKVKFHKKYE